MFKPYIFLFPLIFEFAMFVAPSNGEAQPTVTLSVDDGTAAEAGQDTGQITITRSDDGNTAASLRVYLELGGSATRNSDYAVSNLLFSGGTTYYVTIPANEPSRSVVLTPHLDNLIEGVEDVTFALLGPQLQGHDYTIGAPSEGVVTLSDDVAEVTLTLDDGEATEAGQTTAGFTVTRDKGGRTGVALRVYLELGGSATRNSDYAVSNLLFSGGTTYYVTIPANEPSQSVVLAPFFDEIEEGDENVTFTLLGPQLANHDYFVGSPAQAEIIILDFVDIIFRDGFEQD